MLHSADIADDEMTYIDDSDEEYVEPDFNRKVPPHVVDAITVIYADGTDHPVRCDAEGSVQGNAYEGRSSIRELATAPTSSTAYSADALPLCTVTQGATALEQSPVTNG